jgi:hypothetical protein
MQCFSGHLTERLFRKLTSHLIQLEWTDSTTQTKICPEFVTWIEIGKRGETSINFLNFLPLA